MAGKSISDLAPTHMQPLSGDHILPLRAKHGPERNGRCPRFSGMGYWVHCHELSSPVLEWRRKYFSSLIHVFFHKTGFQPPWFKTCVPGFYIIVLYYYIDIYIYILYIIVHYSPVLSLFHGQGSPSANLLMSTAQLWPFGIDGVPVVYARWSSCSPIFDSDCW